MIRALRRLGSVTGMVTLHVVFVAEDIGAGRVEILGVRAAAVVEP